MDEASLKAMTRKDLQALAKARGVKASLASAEIIATLLAAPSSNADSNSEAGESNVNGISSSEVPQVDTSNAPAEPAESATVPATPAAKRATRGANTTAKAEKLVTTEAEVEGSSAATSESTKATIEVSSGSIETDQVAGTTNEVDSTESKDNKNNNQSSIIGDVTVDGISPSRELKEKLVARKARMTTPKRVGSATLSLAATDADSGSGSGSVAVTLPFKDDAGKASAGNNEGNSTGVDCTNNDVGNQLPAGESARPAELPDYSPNTAASKQEVLLKKLLDRKAKFGAVAAASMTISELAASIDLNVNQVVSTTFKPSRTIRIDNLKPPLINQDFHQWLEKIHGHKIGERYIWISPKKTHCYVSCISVMASKALKEKVTGLKYDEFQSNTFVANYSSVLISEIATSEEASLPPSEWMAYAAAQHSDKMDDNGSKSASDEVNIDGDGNRSNKRKLLDESDNTTSRESKRGLSLGQSRSTTTLPSIEWAPVASDVVDARRRQIEELRA